MPASRNGGQKVVTKSGTSQALAAVTALLNDPSYFWLLAGLLVIGDTMLTQLIIRFIPYTEIDFTTYLYQAEAYNAGERDYSKIEGPSGPLVYPAGHVLIHKLLLHLLKQVSDGTGAVSEDLLYNKHLGQQIYGILYILSLVSTFAVYRRARNIPNWMLIPLVLSKRLHSIFVLRMFNDAWAINFLTSSIWAHITGFPWLGSVLFGAALSIKMNMILYLPALLMLLLLSHGLGKTVLHSGVIVSTVAAVSLPFLIHDPWSYLKNAFDFSRAFLYKWTVNWRFLSQETFESNSLAKGLLVGHLVVLALFGFGKWTRAEGGVFSVLKRAITKPWEPAGIIPMTADRFTTIMFTCNLIGILFARSLHYQFYSWYVQQLPLLMWRTRYPIVLRLALLLAIEYSWNVFPSTVVSSGVLLGSNCAVLLGLWFGYPEGKDSLSAESARQAVPEDVKNK